MIALRRRFSQFEDSRKLEALVLGVIVIVATILRFYRLGAWSFWIDEIFTLNRAAQHVNLETIIAQWWHPSISLILTAGAVEIFGISEWSARLVPAVIGIITIPIFYLCVRRLFGAVVALIAALLLAVSPWHLEWSQNARYYSAMLLFYFLAAYTFYLAIERDRPRYLALSAVLLVLAIGERFIAVFFVPVIFIYLLVLTLLPIEKPAGFRTRNIALILSPGIIFGVIEIVRLLTTGSTYLTGAVALKYSLPIDDPFRLATFIAFDIGIPVMCLAFFSGAYLVYHKSNAGLFVLVNALVPVALLVLISPFYFAKDRYVFMVLPFWLILAAVGVQEVFQQVNASRQILVVGILALLVADAAGDNLLYYQINHGNRHDWRTAFTLVQEQSLPDDRVVSWWTEFGPYYLDRKIISWEIVDRAFVEESGNRFWFVLDEETIWGNGSMKLWIEKHAELVDVIYLRRPMDVQLLIYLYDPQSK